MGQPSWQGDTLHLTIRVQPKAAQERVMGWQGEQLKVALNAPPVDGAANKALCHFLAKQLGIAKGQVTLVRGEKSREKQLVIQGISPSIWQQFLERHGV
ncbi:protein of unknown function DUF167 [Magnetococcus marinus MC-1]|uniref:UPF0235 protein Mmc1_3654 n=1 Tax=Magnetococcus marinus (strain ATCC BAA-1437 / JCM 17883 / MC-1) TaxID=156889 RepID=Y3654_MAGMM|nr:DUF167 domain-containing protein [Magnetococcus marinus]A0LDU6.1 RecName: Full=UPF0235 protein Mmc1_3654 [Magnetococcus marinus MC-1]ABK46139.1 protein of unknown function DUF167 [Magnetococcus marinus MC-1]